MYFHWLLWSLKRASLPDHGLETACLVCRDHKPVVAHVHLLMAICCLLSCIWLTRLPGAETTFLGCARHNGAAVRIRCYDNNNEYNDAKSSWQVHDKNNGAETRTVAKTPNAVCVAALGRKEVISYWDLPGRVHIGSILLLSFHSEVT